MSAPIPADWKGLYDEACRAGAEPDPYVIHPAVVCTLIERIAVLEAQVETLQKERDAARLDAEDKASIARIAIANFESKETP